MPISPVFVSAQFTWKLYRNGLFQKSSFVLERSLWQWGIFLDKIERQWHFNSILSQWQRQTLIFLDIFSSSLLSSSSSSSYIPPKSSSSVLCASGGEEVLCEKHLKHWWSWNRHFSSSPSSSLSSSSSYEVGNGYAVLSDLYRSCHLPPTDGDTHPQSVISPPSSSASYS